MNHPFWGEGEEERKLNPARDLCHQKAESFEMMIRWKGKKKEEKTVNYVELFIV